MARNNLFTHTLNIVYIALFLSGLILLTQSCGVNKCTQQFLKVSDSLNLVSKENDSLYNEIFDFYNKIDSLKQLADAYKTKLQNLDTIIVRDTIVVYDTIYNIDTVFRDRYKYVTKYKILFKAAILKYHNVPFSVYVVDLKKDKLDIYWKKPQTNQLFYSFASLRNYLKKQGHKIEFMANGGIFNPNYVPVGLFIQNGKLIKALNVNDGQGNFYLKPNGVWIIKKDNTSAIYTTMNFQKIYGNDYSKIKYAIQSGPILVFNNKIHPAFRAQSTNQYIRSGVGVLDNHTVIFAISNQPVNFYTFASFFRDYLGCKNALYLDGAISDMYIPAIERFNLSSGYSTIIAVYK